MILIKLGNFWPGCDGSEIGCGNHVLHLLCACIQIFLKLNHLISLFGRVFFLGSLVLQQRSWRMKETCLICKNTDVAKGGVGFHRRNSSENSLTDFSVNDRF